MKYLRYFTFTIICLFLCSSCSFLHQQPEPEKITLNLFTGTFYTGFHDTQELDDLLKLKFPNITFHHYNLIPNNSSGYDGAALSYSELIKKGIIPDLMIENVWLVPHFVQEGLVLDQVPGASGAQIDLDTFQPDLLAQIRAWSPNGELYALPYRKLLHALYYDRDEAKRRGLDLKDGMTWDDILAFSREDQLVNLDAAGAYAVWSGLERQYGLHYIDPHTDEVSIGDDQWKEVLKIWSELNFASDESGKVVLYPASSEYVANTIANWDVVSYPRMNDGSNSGPNGLGDVIAVSPLSTQQQAAFEVMAYMVSEEFQLKNARRGDPSVLVNKEVIEQFGADRPEYNGKHVSSFFELTDRSIPEQLSVFDKSNWMAIAGSGFASTVNSPLLSDLSLGMKNTDEALLDMKNRMDNYMLDLKKQMEESKNVIQLGNSTKQ